jgi:hypothetical protein
MAFALTGATLSMVATVRNPATRRCRSASASIRRSPGPCRAARRRGSRDRVRARGAEASGGSTAMDWWRAASRRRSRAGRWRCARAVRGRRADLGSAEQPRLQLRRARRRLARHRLSRHPMLGVWQKPGARYVCIEPWAGIADPAGFAGDFRDKPGVMELEAGSSRSFQDGRHGAAGRDLVCQTAPRPGAGLGGPRRRTDRSCGTRPRGPRHSHAACR